MNDNKPFKQTTEGDATTHLLYQQLRCCAVANVLTIVNVNPSLPFLIMFMCNSSVQT